MNGQGIVIDALVGTGLPLVIAVLNGKHWSGRVKALVALLVCALAATVAQVIRGELHWADWRAAVLVIAAASMSSYHLLWRPSTITTGIESATSGDGGAGDAIPDYDGT